MLKAKEDSIPKLVKELDRVFSIYIRTRYADANGYVRCFTSGVTMHWKKAQAGHFISRRHYATRWDEHNVQVQSVAENVFNQGNSPVFAKRLTEVYGKGVVEMLLIKKSNTWKPSKLELTLLIKEYKAKIKHITI